MIQWIPIFLFFAFAAHPVVAQQTAIPNQPELTVSLEPRHVKAGRAYVQGQIKLRVQLVSPHPFAALKLDLPPIAAARALTLSPPQTRKIYNFGREGYVYETRLALFPEQSGALTVPSISVVGAMSVGLDQKESFAEVNPEMRVTVKPIDPDYEARWWLVADAATMTEVWSPPPEELRVGDIVRRDVTVTVHGVTAAHLPALDLANNGSYSVVGSATATATHLTPDGVVATLRRFWDLRIETEAVISISPIRLAFWDPAAGAMASASLPAKRIEPLPRDAAALQHRLMHDAVTAHRNRRIGLFAALSVPGLALLALMVMALHTFLPTRADRRLSQTCAGPASPVICFQAVTRWSRDSFVPDDCNGIGHLQQKVGGEAVDRLDTLQAALFSASEVGHEPERLAQSLVHAARRHRLHQCWQSILRGLYRLVGTRQNLIDTTLPGRTR